MKDIMLFEFVESKCKCKVEVFPFDDDLPPDSLMKQTMNVFIDALFADLKKVISVNYVIERDIVSDVHAFQEFVFQKVKSIHDFIIVDSQRFNEDFEKKKRNNEEIMYFLCEKFVF